MGDKEEKPVVNSEGNEADVEDAEEVDAEEVEKTLPNLQSGMIALLQSRLGKLVGHPSGYIDSLPKTVKRRIKALKKLQLETFNLEAKFYQEVHNLECKYASLYSPYYTKRCQFISGEVEPTEEECDFPSECDTEEEEVADDSAKKETDDMDTTEKAEDMKGIPEFWLTTFKNVALIADMIQDHDEPILRHLKDVILKLHQEEPMGFTLEFHFEPNDFFANSVLTKEYEMKCKTEEKDPLSFEGPELIKCKGCTIDWKKGANVTVKTVKKKQKHKSKGSVRTVLKTVQNDSFFNFFNPPAIPADEEAVDSETEALLNADFEIGHFLKDRVIPRAVLYFTGEALTDFEDDEEEEDEGEDEEDGDEGSDPDYKIDKKYKKQPPPECKQQ